MKNCIFLLLVGSLLWCCSREKENTEAETIAIDSTTSLHDSIVVQPEAPKETFEEQALLKQLVEAREKGDEVEVNRLMEELTKSRN